MRQPTLLVFSLVAALLGASSAFAQSLPNYGPNAPTGRDTFGAPQAEPTRPRAEPKPMRTAHIASIGTGIITTGTITTGIRSIPIRTKKGRSLERPFACLMQP